jgi:hypothetical protein
VTTIITNTFPKQPREVKWYAISFAELLAAMSDTPRATDPIEFDTIPDGITLEAQEFVDGVLNVLIAAGTDKTRYKLTVFLYTARGQKIEHQVTVYVKER